MVNNLEITAALLLFIVTVIIALSPSFLLPSGYNNVNAASGLAPG